MDDPRTNASDAVAPAAADAPVAARQQRRRRSALATLFTFLLIIAALLLVSRLVMPSTVKWYVNRVLDQSPLYDGKIDGIDIHLYRGAYTIRGIRINKKTGSVPVPLFAAKRVDLAIEWEGLLAGNIVGAVKIDQPELNFVDGGNDGGGQGGDGGGQTGAGAPWLSIITDLFPFKINSVVVNDGSVHFRAYQKNVPIDVYLSQLHASVDNLTNIHESTAPLITTVKADALAMDQAKFEYQMKLDPFSYKPTFNLTTRLLNVDVTKINDLARGYGSIDFEHGWFDLVVEVEAKEGALRGYVKPLFRNLKILDLKKDLDEDNILQTFWEGVVGGAEFVLKNQSRDQFGTLIPFTGNVDAPRTDVIATIGNVLQNAFIRAYLPRLDRGGFRDTAGLEFGPASPMDAIPGSDESKDTEKP